MSGSPGTRAKLCALCLPLVISCGESSGASSPGSSREVTAADPTVGSSAGGGRYDTIPVVEPPPSDRRHVIIMIGDGMQMAHEVATSRYLTGRDDGLSFHAFPTHVFKTTWDIEVYDNWAKALNVATYSRTTFNPIVGYDPARGGTMPYPLLPDNPERRTYFTSEPTPDSTGPLAARSSSTGTAMSTGMKTSSDNIAWAADDPSDGALETSAEFLRRVLGMSIGFVTTGPFTDATPATWFAHNVRRDNLREICEEMLTRTRPDVIIGGGRATPYIVPELIEAMKTDPDYVYVERQDGANGNDALSTASKAAREGKKKLFGLFGKDTDPYKGNFQWPVPVHAPGAPAFEAPPLEEPSFANATIAALDVLSQNPNGFFAMFEQEDIDLASHELNFSRQVGCVHDLDEAVKAVVGFIDRPGDGIDWSNTTLLVTADHANSYLRLEKTLGSGKLPAQVMGDNGWEYPDGSISYWAGAHTNELINVYVRGRAASRVKRYATLYPGQPYIIDDTSIYQLTLDAAFR